MRRRTRLALALALLALPATANGPEGRGDGASRLPPGDSASEYWDLSIHLDSGHRVFARFLITNEGPGDRSAAAFGHVVMPDGSTRRFDNAKRAGSWELSSDGLRLRIASSILDQRPPRPKFEYDSNRRGVKLHLWYQPDGALAHPESAALPDYASDLLAAAGPLQGTLWVEGMAEPLEVSGRLGATHTWTRRSESDLVARRIEFFSLDADTSLYLSDVLTPKGARLHWLVVERAGERWTSDAFEVALEAADEASDYPVPAALRLSGAGIEGRIALGPELVQDAPFDALPQPFRFLLSLRARPRRVWLESAFELKLEPGPGRPEAVLRGSGVTAVTFTNPLPQG